MWGTFSETWSCRTSLKVTNHWAILLYPISISFFPSPQYKMFSVKCKSPDVESNCIINTRFFQSKFLCSDFWKGSKIYFHSSSQADILCPKGYLFGFPTLAALFCCLHSLPNAGCGDVLRPSTLGPCSGPKRKGITRVRISEGSLECMKYQNTSHCTQSSAWHRHHHVVFPSQLSQSLKEQQAPQLLVWLSMDRLFIKTQ